MEVDTDANGYDTWENPVVVKTGINSEEMAVTYRHFGIPKHGWIKGGKAFKDDIQLSAYSTLGIKCTTSRNNNADIYIIYSEPENVSYRKILIQQLEP